MSVTRPLPALLDGLAEVQGLGEVGVSGLSLDSRRLRSGDAFVALTGIAGHGLDHLDQALAAGAVAVLHDGRADLPAACPVPTVAVPALATHLPTLAQRMWPDAARGMDLVAVTGTNGKSSVAWLLARALDGAMIGTLGIGRPGAHRRADMTTPDVLTLYRELDALRAAGSTTVVMEASSHALDQQRLAGLVLTSTIFTNLGHDHLDYHSDLESYAAAKARLFFDYPTQRRIINLDDAFGRSLAGRLDAGAGLIGYSQSDRPLARLRVDSAVIGPEGINAELLIDGRRVSVCSTLLGRVNLWNLLVVAAELFGRGWTDAEIAESLARLEPVPGRMQAIRDGEGRLVVVDYAHTPDALANALDSLRELGQGSLWCVFGCGGDRDRAKRAPMGQIAERLADRVVLTDDNPRHEDGLAIVRAIQAGMARPQRCLVVRDRSTAIARAITESSPGDIVLVAGKGHESEQITGDRRLPFDDAACVRQALEAQPC